MGKQPNYKVRGNGDGTIFRRSGTEYWIAQITLSSSNGKLIRRSKNAKTKNQAKEALKQLQEQYKYGIITPDQTLEQYLEYWIDKVLSKRNVKLTTIDNYCSILKLYVFPRLGNKKLTQLKTQDVDDLLDELASQNLSRSTIARTKIVLSSALKHAESRELIIKNVAQSAIIPQATTKVGRSMTQHEAKLFLEAAKGTRCEVAWIIMLMLGLRSGEVRGLSWKDIDFENNTLKVVHSLNIDGRIQSDEPRKLILSEPKTPKSRRTLDMPEKVVEALRLHQTNQNIQQAKAGGLWHNTGLVFTTQIGTGIYPSNFRREFNKVIAKANLGRWHPHELRHTAISLLSANGVRLEDIADLAGHSTTRMTSEVYRHQVQESVSAHLKPMNKMFDDN